MLKYRRLPVALVAACLTVGLAVAPSAMAASPSAKTSASRPTAKSVNLKLNKTNKSLTATRKSLSKVTKDLGALAAALKGEQGKTALLLSAAPQLVDGLTKLSSAVQNQIAPGLLALQAALETKVQPALLALQDGLEKKVPAAIKEVATSQEYGVSGLVVDAGGTGTTCCTVATVASNDIPDDGNTATASGTFPIVVDATPTGNEVPEDSEVSIRSAIRSGETDGAATGDPAGQVGGLLTVKCVSIGGCGSVDFDGAGGNPAVPIEAGALTCAVGPTASSSFPTPAGPANLRLRNIQQKAARTDQSKPGLNEDAVTINPLNKAGTSESDAMALVTGDPAANASDLNCTLGNSGTYEVTIQTQFVDLPTSAEPKVTD